MSTKAEDDELSFELLARANAPVVRRLAKQFDDRDTQRGEGKGKTEAGSDKDGRANLAGVVEKRFKRVD